MTSVELSYEHYGAHAARNEIRDTIVELFEATHEQTGPFYSTSRLLERFEDHSSCEGFELVLALAADGTPVGLMYGFTMPSQSRWWQGLRNPVTNGFAETTKARTLAVAELLVRPEWRRKGVARRLHDELLADRPDEQASLLVDPDNAAAQAAYAAWGWTKVGELQPFADAPVYDALMISLKA